MKLLIQDKNYYDESNKPVFIVGPDSPENFLAPQQFPGHGGQRGALDYLASFGVNSVSMIVNNWKGDGQDVFPWTDYNMGDPGATSRTYDIAKLQSWRDTVSYANSLGIHVVIKLWEIENQDEWGVLNDRTQLYYDAIIRTFRNLSVTYVAGEENRLPSKDVIDVLKYLRSIGAENISIHNWPTDWDRQKKQLAPHVDVFSLQSDLGTGANKIATYDKAVSWDEQGPWQTGIRPDQTGLFAAKYTVMLPCLFGGAAGCSFYFGSPSIDPQSNDLFVDTYQVYEELWKEVGNLQLALTRSGFDFTSIDRTGRYNATIYGIDSNGVCLLVGPENEASILLETLDGNIGDFFYGTASERLTGNPTKNVFVAPEGNIVSVPFTAFQEPLDPLWTRQQFGKGFIYREGETNPSLTYDPVDSFEICMKVPEPGRYRIFLHNMTGDRNEPYTDYNDCWMKVNKALFIEDINAGGPNPASQNLVPGSWVKVYSNRRGVSPSWQTHLVDEDPHTAMINVSSVDEIISVRIAGRSANFCFIGVALALEGEKEWDVPKALYAQKEMIVVEPEPVPVPGITPLENVTEIKFESPKTLEFKDGILTVKDS